MDRRGNFGILSANLFTGSLYGSKPLVFSVMAFAIANHLPHEDDEIGPCGIVELNPRLLAGVFDVPAQQVSEAIRTLASPDPESRSEECEGRRIVPVGRFRWLLVNAGKYRRTRRSREEQREYWRQRKAEQRRRAREEECVDVPDCPPVPSSLEGPSSSASSSSTPKSTTQAEMFSTSVPFEDWYSRYPRKAQRPNAERAWSKLKPADQAAALEDIGERAPLLLSTREKSKIPYPATFLNAREWEDPLPEPSRSAAPDAPSDYADTSW